MVVDLAAGVIGKIMNIGKVIIKDDDLLRYLDFYPDGSIVNIHKSERHGFTDIVISHPDMPLLNEGDVIIEVMPMYIKHHDSIGRESVFREKKVVDSA